MWKRPLIGKLGECTVVFYRNNRRKKKNLMTAMYDDAEVKIVNLTSDRLVVIVGLYEGWHLSPLPFITVSHAISQATKKEHAWDMLYVYMRLNYCSHLGRRTAGETLEVAGLYGKKVFKEKWWRDWRYGGHQRQITATYKRKDRE